MYRESLVAVIVLALRIGCENVPFKCNIKMGCKVHSKVQHPLMILSRCNQLMI